MFKNTTTVVKNLIIINILVFLIQEYAPNGFGAQFTDMLALHTVWSEKFRLYQYVTSIFLHASFTHLFSNMFALWMFGQILENRFYSQRFLIYYLITGIGAGILHSAITAYELYDLKQLADTSSSLFTPDQWAIYNSNIDSITVGASGAVFGILLGFGVLYPNERIMLLIPPIPMKAKYFVLGYGVLELLLGMSVTSTNIAHFAHVGGMIFGYITLAIWRRKLKIWE